jgi:hypothetical protein
MKQLGCNRAENLLRVGYRHLKIIFLQHRLGDETHMNGPVGRQCWAIPEGYLPEKSHGPKPQMTSHGSICVLNTADDEAQLTITIYFSDREPAGPYYQRVPPRRTRHLRFNNFADPEPIPLGTDFSSVIESNVPVVVQHTRLNSRQSENALMTTMAFPDG